MAADNSIQRFLRESDWSHKPIVLAVIVVVELGLLFYFQRYLYMHTARAARSTILTYAIVMPGTVLHELSHFLMCKILFVPAGDDLVLAGGRRGKVHWFWPERQPGGGIVLGYVEHQRTDPFRNALIAIAPVLLVPLMLFGWCVLLLGTSLVHDPMGAFMDAGLVAKVAVTLGVVLGASAPFPSAGDHVGAVGAIFLVGLVGGGGYALHASGRMLPALQVVAGVLAVPAAAGLVNRFILIPALARGRS